MKTPPRTRGPARRLVMLLVLLSIVFVACTKDAPMNFLHPEGPIAKEADELWRLTSIIAYVVFFLVEGALVFVLFKYRAKGKGGIAPKQTHGNTRLEIVWTAIPVLLLTGIAIPTVKGIADLYSEPKAGALEIKVVGHQWWWEFEYDEFVTANELHIPIDRPVRLRLESVDVIHSFWVPKLAGKQDAVPGRANFMNLVATKPGTYLGQCVEYCGLSHANMRFMVVAQEKDAFEAWAAGQAEDARGATAGLPLEGQRLFVEGACAGCHAIKGTSAEGIVGPNLSHLASRTTFASGMFDLNEENLVAWLKNPPARKPGSKMPNLNLSDEEITALVAYLQTLE